MGSGSAQFKETAAWSEKGQGKISQEFVKWSQDNGHPMRSMRDDKRPFGFNQLNAIEDGCKERHTSMTQHSKNAFQM